VRERRPIGLREVRALGPGEVVWDAAVPGFGARRQAGTAVSYFLKYRNLDGRQRWRSIGRHGAPWTPDTARAEAKRLLGVIVVGGDPAADHKARKQAGGGAIPQRPPRRVLLSDVDKRALGF
jgi:Arm DNA-binding domain